MKGLSLLHFADLHLSESDRDYSMAVLSELLERASSCDAVVIAGDLFDSFADMRSLWKPVMELFASYAKPVVYCVGNHEYLGIGRHSFSEFAPAANVHFVWEPGAASIRAEGLDVEFVVLPFSPVSGMPDLSSLSYDEALPRVLVAHGTLGGMYDFFSDEEDKAFISPSFVDSVSADYVALGHIHGFFSGKRGRSVVCYPGSSRVWRAGERGQRYAVRVSLAKEISTNRLVLSSAGQWRDFYFACGLDDVSSAKDWELSSSDYVTVYLEGVAETMDYVASLKAELKNALDKAVRRLEIKDDGVDYLTGISEHKIVKSFTVRMNELKGKYEPSLWRRAFIKGLIELKEVLSK